jgi:hypothetical protein
VRSQARIGMMNVGAFDHHGPSRRHEKVRAKCGLRCEIYPRRITGR